MKAIVQDSYGAPSDVLWFSDVPEPEIADQQVLVRVRAAGVSIGDWLTVQGLPYIARPGYGLTGPKHRIPGYELAGRVERVGSEVEGLRPGDEVFGWGRDAFAELAALDADALAQLPDNLSPEAASTVPVSAMAALQALRVGGVRPGRSVLVIGASGGVGTFAVQIAKARGAHVTAVCGTSTVDLVRSLGADHVIDYRREELADQRRWDVVLNLAGNRPVSVLRRLVAPHGTLVMVGSSGGPWLMGFGRTIAGAALSPFVRQRIRTFFSKGSAEDLGQLQELLRSGKVAPVIDRTFPLAAAAEALDHVGARRNRGKSVIVV
jgi:NADPH:quinone reductase-like Zn-dependent oxidoreductase